MKASKRIHNSETKEYSPNTMDLQSLYTEIEDIQNNMDVDSQATDWMDIPVTSVYEDDDRDDEISLVDLGDGNMITREELDRVNNWVDVRSCMNCLGCVFCSGIGEYDGNDEI